MARHRRAGACRPEMPPKASPPRNRGNRQDAKSAKTAERMPKFSGCQHTAGDRVEYERFRSDCMGIAIFITGLVVGVIHLGPCFGALVGGGVSLVIALPADAIWRSARRAGSLDSARKRRLITAGGCVCFGIPFYVLMSPPSGRALLREHLHLPTTSVHEVRRWSTIHFLGGRAGGILMSFPAARSGRAPGREIPSSGCGVILKPARPIS